MKDLSEPQAEVMLPELLTQRVRFRSLLVRLSSILLAVGLFGMVITFFAPSDSLGAKLFQLSYRCIMCTIPFRFAGDFIGWSPRFWLDALTNRLSVVAMSLGWSGALLVTMRLEAIGVSSLYLCFGILYSGFILMVTGYFLTKPPT